MHRTGGTYSQICMMEPLEYAISELYFGKFPNQMTFSVGESTSRPKCAQTHPFFQLTMSWINEVEMAKSSMMTQTIEGKSFLDFEMLECEDCVYVEKNHIRKPFQEKSQCRRAATSKIQQFLEREANCLHDPWTLSINWSL